MAQSLVKMLSISAHYRRSGGVDTRYNWEVAAFDTTLPGIWLLQVVTNTMVNHQAMHQLVLQCQRL